MTIHSPNHAVLARTRLCVSHSGSTVHQAPHDQAHDGSLDPTRVFPRKEVIQPQLPLRLPCYDFVPIINPTLDGCLP